MDYAKLYEYYIFLFFNYNYHDTSLLNKRDYDLDEVYNYIYVFWKEYFEEELDISKEENKEILFDFVNEVFRYKLLNDNLYDLYNIFTDEKEDKFFINNQNEIIEIVGEILNTTSSIYKYDEEKLPKLSYDDLDKFFEEFLLLIDNSGDFLNIYKSIKEEKRIIYFDKLNNVEKIEFKKKINKEENNNNNFFFRDDNKIGYILLDRKGNISDFRTLTHEFIHYCVFFYNKDKDPYYFIMEFPSIFYEYISNKFLFQKGFSQDDINNLLSYRFKDVKDKSKYLKCVNNYLYLYVKNNYNISHEIDTEFIKEKITNFIEKYGEKEFKKELKNNNNIKNPKIIANNNCDTTNFYLSKYPNDLVNNYPYLLGNYLSIYYLKKLVNNNFSLNEMTEFVKNLADLDPKIILKVKESEDIEKRKKYILI